jgi:NDP-sugar pyrophosphorylase family protein
VLVGEGCSVPASVRIEAPALICTGAEVGERARLSGPVVVGSGAVIGADAALRESILMPGVRVPDREILIGAIAADAAALARPVDVWPIRPGDSRRLS